MKKYILFLGCFCAVMSNCSQSPVTTSTSSEQRRKTKTIPSSIKASEIIIKSHSSKSTPSPSPAVASQSEDFKAWFGSLGATAEPGKISKANIKIGAPNWLDGFNFTDNKSVVVNASNESISFGGGGLNGALHKYATQKEGQTEW